MMKAGSAKAAEQMKVHTLYEMMVDKIKGEIKGKKIGDAMQWYINEGKGTLGVLKKWMET